MRIPRLFTSQPLTAGERITLNADASHYLVNVLRLQPERPLILFNGDGADYPATLVVADRRAAQVDLGERRPNPCESPLQTTLAIGISRGERFDWAVQKATELGVTRIQPLWTARVEVRLRTARLERKLAHWRQVAIAASEQSGRARPPEIAVPTGLDAYLATARPGLRLVLDPAGTGSLPGARTQTSVDLLVGPEGGLEAGELTASRTAGFVAWRLGPRTLRTETAPLAALAILQYRFGDTL